ncbi:Uncharacterised protein [Mycobacteroides abscessus subsp. abscessus]|nr:Uncharacterised protein [Mycobacteroides abscessus subsp. abscessus]
MTKPSGLASRSTRKLGRVEGSLRYMLMDPVAIGRPVAAAASPRAALTAPVCSEPPVMPLR